MKKRKGPVDVERGWQRYWMHAFPRCRGKYLLECDVKRIADDDGAYATVLCRQTTRVARGEQHALESRQPLRRARSTRASAVRPNRSFQGRWYTSVLPVTAGSAASCSLVSAARPRVTGPKGD
jgi:hypothetical protein